ELVNEPMMGEIRLQWWRDVLERGLTDGGTGSPVADALLETIARHNLPVDTFIGILAARSRELAPDAFATEEALDGYLDDTDGAAFGLAARILVPDGDDGIAKLASAAGQAFGRIRLLRALPASLAKGRSVLPLEGADWAAAVRPILDAARVRVGEARQRLPAAPAAVLPAMLPVALVEPYLAALQRLGPDIAREKADISPLTRVWRLWRASVRGRI
ncbi:MAG TPA: squalene/phytoene synthase family protein, partial [Hyphomicrobium sp.]